MINQLKFLTIFNIFHKNLSKYLTVVHHTFFYPSSFYTLFSSTDNLHSTWILTLLPYFFILTNHSSLLDHLPIEFLYLGIVQVSLFILACFVRKTHFFPSSGLLFRCAKKRLLFLRSFCLLWKTLFVLGIRLKKFSITHALLPISKPFLKIKQNLVFFFLQYRTDWRPTIKGKQGNTERISQKKGEWDVKCSKLLPLVI